MKKYIGIGKILAIAVLVLSVIFLYNNNIKYSKEISILEANQKAFITENSSLKNDNRVFKFTIEQLNYYNDSLLQKIKDVKEELNIKDKDIKELQYIASKASKKDTIVFIDTLFRNAEAKVDTLVGDKWYNIKLDLIYPNIIITEPEFISEKYIITKYNKETVKPPKKFFIARWFQKKHKIMEVEVVEKNPYIKDTQQRFIEIIN